jgi:MFS family permease
MVAMLTGFATTATYLYCLRFLLGVAEAGGFPIMVATLFSNDPIRPFHQHTNIAGLPNFAPHSFKSVSVTPRAREQAPQEKMGMCFATTFDRD